MSFLILISGGGSIWKGASSSTSFSQEGVGTFSAPMADRCRLWWALLCYCGLGGVGQIDVGCGGLYYAIAGRVGLGRLGRFRKV